MSDPFFARPKASGTKRKRNETKSLGASKSRTAQQSSKGKKPAKRAREEDDEEIDEGGSGSDLGQGRQLSDVSSGEDESETAAQKRLRLAKMYLENLEQSKQGALWSCLCWQRADSMRADRPGFDAEEIDKDIIAERLQRDVVCLLYCLLYVANAVLGYTALSNRQDSHQNSRFRLTSIDFANPLHGSRRSSTTCNVSHSFFRLDLVIHFIERRLFDQMEPLACVDDFGEKDTETSLCA